MCVQIKLSLTVQLVFVRTFLNRGSNEQHQNLSLTFTKGLVEIHTSEEVRWTPKYDCIMPRGDTVSQLGMLSTKEKTWKSYDGRECVKTSQWISRELLDLSLWFFHFYPVDLCNSTHSYFCNLQFLSLCLLHCPCLCPVCVTPVL